jgi:hypothetical protein
MGLLKIECDTGKVSDGHHTFDELYEHRCVLFICLMRCNPGISWRARRHSDGTAFDGWFIAGMQLQTGQVTYHLPEKMWVLLDGSRCPTHILAPLFDGHSPKNVPPRLAEHFCPVGQE